MTLGEIEDLFAYTSWANGRMFDAAGDLAPDELSTPVASSYPSVRATLAHIVMAEWVWLRRWLGESPTGAPSWVEQASLAALRGQLDAVESERALYLATLTDDDLKRPIEYVTMAGEPEAEPLATLIRHVVNHSTYHRGQVATQLRQQGKTPPSTDLIVWLRQAE